MTNYKKIPNHKIQITNKKETKGHHSSFIIHNSFIVRPFDLSYAPLLRAGLVKKIDGSYFLLVDMHHIISDGVSRRILVQDYHALYNEEKIPSLMLQYKDYSQWQNCEREKENLKRQEAFWVKEFAGEIPVLEIPTDYPRPLIQSFAGNSIDFEIAAGETRAINAVALREGATLFMALAAAVNILLSKLSGQEEIIVGTPIAGRRHTDLEKIIGMFVNTLSLRNYPAGDRRFREFLGDIKERVLMVFENQEYPFEELVDKLPVKRDTGRNPLFDVMFVLQNMNTGVPDQDKETGIETSRPDQPGFPGEYENILQTAKFDLTLTAMERNRGLFLSFQYCTRLFKKETVERFINYFKKIVSIAVKEPDIRISDLEIVSKEEKSRILLDFNDTERDYPKKKILRRLFEEQVERSPDRIALLGPGDRGAFLKNRPHAFPDPQKTFYYLTYRELNEKSTRLAGLLIEKGVQPDTIVGIMVERSVEMIIGIMGILKAGAAYLPIDPEYPQERIDYMLKDSGANALVTTSTLAQEVKKLRSSEVKRNPETIFIDAMDAANPTSSQLLNFSTSSSLAYIIYTSGSTGKPKGVMVEHGSVINILWALQSEYPLEETDAYLLKTSYLFDVSVTELFGWFWTGGRLAVLARGGEKDPQSIIRAIRNWKITHINFVPSMFNAFVEILNPQRTAELSGLKYIFLAGEALIPGMVEKFRQLGTNILLENIYGPTEGTVYASKYSLSAWKGAGDIPIGKPLQNIKLYILDKYDNCQPIGAAGELCIGGAGLARGYMNRPALTAGKFDHNLWDYRDKRKKAPGCGIHRSSRSYKSYIYHTGDLARWLPEGNIEYLGRIDFQVKVRGFRVELGEIEYVLSAHPGIKAAVVASKEGNDGRYLCAYVTPQNTQEAEPQDPVVLTRELQDYLSHRLPYYMVPGHFVVLEKMPLTAAGKADRQVLSNLKEFVPGTGAAYAAPGNDMEKLVAGIWKEVLHLEEVGVHDNFFTLGGNSINILKVNSRLEMKLKKSFPVVKMFKYPTVHAFAHYLLHGDDEVLPVEKEKKISGKMARGKDRLRERSRRRNRGN
jgi:amino acid adenylation domain-containing protein